jgi:hypothetical protein
MPSISFQYPDGRTVPVRTVFRIAEVGGHNYVAMSFPDRPANLPPFELDGDGGEDPNWLRLNLMLSRLRGFTYDAALRRRFAEMCSDLHQVCANSVVQVRYRPTPSFQD